MGSNCERFEEFPDNKYALKNEMWYVMDAGKVHFCTMVLRKKSAGKNLKEG